VPDIVARAAAAGYDVAATMQRVLGPQI